MAKKTKAADLSIEEKLEQALVVPGYEPYKIPDNWCWTTLEYAAKWGSGGTPSRKVTDYYLGDIPWVKTGELDNDFVYETEEHISEVAIRNSSAKLYPVNTVMIAMYGATIGKVGIMGVKATTNQACANAVCENNVYYKYLFYYAISQKDSFISKGKGGAQPNISQEVIKKHEFPLPPLPEQHRIVERIESLFSKLDEAKEKAQEVIDSFEARKAAILHKAFSGELTVKWREENGVGIESWERKRISECCKLGSGGTPSRKNPNYYTGDIPWIKTGEINWNTVNYSEESITQEAIDNSSAKVYAPGAVLVAMYGMGITRGKAAILGIEAATNQAVCVLQPKGYLFNRYLYFFFMCNYWDIREQAVGGNQLNLSATIIGKLNIDIPNLEEQYVITELLDSIIEKEYQTKQIAESVIDQIDAMKKAILARAFRGELGTNDPEEESAGELLKQILSGE